MGVPALFRWLSRKYPKIVLPVIEDHPTIIPSSVEGEEPTEIPVDTRKPNPNGTENDCLYLDMNGIVHPCTHPEGKAAPKTEEDMMMEVFKYTERVVNMARPRKVLLMAIDGVAPRAKMNQQRSRRFRAADEAKTKAKEKEEAIKEWEAMGKEISAEYRNEAAWDSNAITPGTPFMDLLAASLRYWVAYKMNTDPAWANLQVIISDASVPGEGEHKIMDFVRRQRSQPGYDPNTTHVFYGLDADLIMLSLATHEPNFKILREDVFAQAAKKGCHKCGQPGHHSSKCTGITPEMKAEAEAANKSSPLKPFIFLDVCVLREYLEVELDVPGLPFKFDLERAIDDWVFMIFFVGNDFLPHLPSLDIREGAIDMLLKIWREALPQMGGYLTNNGSVDLKAAQIIMDGLAQREDEIFRKRKETEHRQEQQDKEKRRRIEAAESGRRDGYGGGRPGHPAFNGNGSGGAGAQSEEHSFRNGLTHVPVLRENKEYRDQQAQAAASSAAPASGESASTPSLPVKPATAGIGPPKPKNPMFVSSRPNSAAIRSGFIHSAPNGPAGGGKDDVSKELVANRAAIRKANLSAAEMLRAELAGGKPVSAKSPDPAPAAATAVSVVSATATSEEETEAKPSLASVDPVIAAPSEEEAEEAKPVPMVKEPDGTQDALISSPPVVPESVEEDVPVSAVDGTGPASSVDVDVDVKMEAAADGTPPVPVVDESPRGKKRSADEAEIPASRSQAEKAEAEDEGISMVEDEADGDKPSAAVSGESSSSDDDDDDDEDDAANTSVMIKPHVPKPMKVTGNMVEQEDTVKLWEPGYKERYYEQKFGVGIEDADFRWNCAKHYVEGLCWVLAYYYNGCPSWTWYYPEHFAPFASDFTRLDEMDIKFNEGKPFKPFEQLMGVFPAASRKHIPEAFQGLMVEEDSEIIDFYPEEFHVDMNGKKMLWQGVALLPFIDQERLLAALAKRYPKLTEDEVRRNTSGNEVIFVNEDNPFYNQICSLYMKRKVDEPMSIDASLSRGIRGTILPDKNCVPNSTYMNPLTTLPLSDLQDDRSISALWHMPTQHVPHKSFILPGYRQSRRVLTPDDINLIHRGLSGDDGRGRFRGGPAGDGFHSQRRTLEQGPGFGAPRRDARSMQDPRRSNGGGDSRSGSGYNTPTNSYDRHSQSGYGGSGGRDAPRSGPYSGYSAPPPRSGGYDSPQQGYSAPYGGYGGSSSSYQNPPAPPAQPSYGGYGGSKPSSSYGGYGASSYPGHPPASSYPPSGGQGQYSSYGAPPTSSYGGYGAAASSYGGSGAAAGRGYQPPQAAPASSYGGYGGYGQAQPPAGQAGGYRPPQATGGAPPAGSYSNRSAIVPAHLQGAQQPQGRGWPAPSPSAPAGQHQRWSR